MADDSARQANPNHDVVAANKHLGPILDGTIEPSPNSFFTVVIPVTSLLSVFGIIAYFAPYVASCQNAWFITLTYPLVFGAVGAVLGGSIVIEGPIPIFGAKSSMRVLGGLAGVVLGFAIATFAVPSDCEARDSLIIRGVPRTGTVNVVENGAQKKRFYTGYIDTTSTISTTVEQHNSIADTVNLRVRFNAANPSRDGFQVKFIYHRSELDNASKYEFAWSCPLTLTLQEMPSGNVSKYKLESSSLTYEIAFNKAFFADVERAIKKGSQDPAEVTCFRGRSKLEGNDPVIEDRVSPDFYAARSKRFSERALWYVIEKISKPDDKTPNDKIVAQGSSEEPPSDQPKAPITKIQAAPTEPKASRIEPSCGIDPAIKPNADKYVAGDDLDANARTDIYNQGSAAYCYIWPIIKNGSDPSDRARAVRLLANVIINNSLDPSDPTYWQPQGANKRDFSRRLPMLAETDYRAIFDLIRSSDSGIRREATRFVRLLPVDRFAALYNEYAERSNLAPAERERIAIASAFSFYGRIVEWLDASPEDSGKVASQVSADFNASKKWLGKDVLGESAKAYEAMLWYAKAIVERERIRIDDGKTSFRQVLDAISNTSEPYPSNPLHLAQAVAIVFAADPATTQLALRDIRSAEGYPPATLLDTQIAQTGPTLFAGPNTNYKRTIAKILSKDGSARVLLRKNDWLFVQNKDQIGWLKRS
jgi:hypothetical protein